MRFLLLCYSSGNASSQQFQSEQPLSFFPLLTSMPFRDINTPPVCPYCTLKMHCEKHKGQPYHGITAGLNRPQDAQGTLDRLYREMIGSKLERFKNQEDKRTEKEQAKSYWASILEKRTSTGKHLDRKMKKAKEKKAIKKYRHDRSKRHYSSKERSRSKRSNLSSHESPEGSISEATRDDEDISKEVDTRARRHVVSYQANKKRKHKKHSHTRNRSNSTVEDSSYCLPPSTEMKH
ncbi:hypothetical protein IE077_000075 [Cardiosporidium cionae]|uniref:Uncharacterized protein n=1 Tax=Cardiosporidium cionae TaxID=476202 RepID=A0ABQ7JDI7_9APIC|nr:hypothetical protein IE077_000075 [Cardiosporidium cionae]|eukprot:KAF8822082.1 hypothetical protein IE077_000075 [Cardiosporidium cionae]